MQEVVINTRGVGLGLSLKAVRQVAARMGDHADADACLCLDEMPRHDPILVDVIRAMGTEASGGGADLRLRTIRSEYANFYSVKAHADGSEHIKIHHEAFKIHAATQLLARNPQGLSASERIARALAVLRAPLFM